MTDVHIGKDGSGQVTHDLVHVDQNTAVALAMKGNRLDARIDLGPLLGPVVPDRLMTPDGAAFESLRPGYVLSHRRKGGVNVPRVEGLIGSFQ